MNFKINSKIFEAYPDLVLGLVLVKDVDNFNGSGKIIELLRLGEENLRKVEGIEQVNSFPKIESWREAHKKFGSSPKKNAPSIQALVKRTVKGGSLPHINKLVDLYNYISLKYIIPVGGEDIDKCQGGIELTYATGNEEFIELGSTEENPPRQVRVCTKIQQGLFAGNLIGGRPKELS